MTKEVTKPASGEAKVKRTRAPAKDRTIYVVTESKIEGVVHVVKNGEALVEAMDAANEAGKSFHYRKITVPAGR